MTLDAPDHLERMLTRLKLTAIRDQLDSLLDEAARRELTLREALTFLCEREIARKDQRRIDMAMGLARFPFARDLAGFDFGAQPSIDKAQIRELATGRFIANGEAVLLLGPPGVGKSQVSRAMPGPMPRGRRRSFRLRPCDRGSGPVSGVPGTGPWCRREPSRSELRRA